MTYLSKEIIESAPAMTGTAPDLDTSNLPENPEHLFAEWFNLAVEQGVDDVRAMNLATVDEGGVPDVRIVNLMALDENGWSFGTGATTPKAHQLQENQVAALNFFWQPQLRAVRIRGTAVLAPQPEGASGGFQIWSIKPTHVEFWQGGGGYNATRIHYDFAGDTWELSVEDKS